MTDTVAAVIAEAQPEADANSIDTLIENAAKEQPTEEPAEPPAPEAEPEVAFPKKAVNAISRRDKQIGKLKAEAEHWKKQAEEAAKANPKSTQDKTDNPGEPQEKDFVNYHDYIRALNKYDNEKLLEKTLTEREGKHKETQASEREMAWEAERIKTVDKQAEEFAKLHPEVTQMYEEYSDVIAAYPKEIKKALLAADNAPLAFFNLAKEGKLESLAEMSLVDATVEIRLAQMNQPVKPQTKAPTPLPASRGSVAATKSPTEMSVEETLRWLKT